MKKDRKFLNAAFLVDGYKVLHHMMYPEGTEIVFSNFTARSNKFATIKGANSVVVGVIQYVLADLVDRFDREFFLTSERIGKSPEDLLILKKTILDEIEREFTMYTGMDYDIKHFSKLWDLGYLPVEIRSMDEGLACPIKVPYFTIHNTHKEFFWVTNYLETIISNMVWPGITSATTTRGMRSLVDKWAIKTTGTKEGTDYQLHDFSMRGLKGVDNTVLSGIGFLMSSHGTDNIPAIPMIRWAYGDEGNIGNGVAATEHSIMTSEGEDGEFGIMENLIEKFPNGFLSVVSDSYDYWRNLTEYLPRLKDRIMARDGRYVARPDCYSDDTLILSNRGWVLFTELNSDDLVAQVLDDGTYEFVKPLKIINQRYKGKMIHFHDYKGKVDLLVTPNHRMVYEQNGEMKIQNAEDCIFRWKKNIIKSAKSINGNISNISNLDRLKIAFQADGSYTTTGNKIRFSFSKERKKNRLINILDNCGIEYKIYNLKDGRVEFNIDINSDELKKDFSWVNLDELNYKWSEEFIEELSYWDSTRRSDNRFKFDTINKNVIDVVEIIGISAGYSVLVSKFSDNRKKHFSDVYTAHILKNNLLGGQAITKEEIEYDGNVVCVQVPSGKLIVKRNRGSLVCGNSGNVTDIICGTVRDIYPDRDIKELTEELNDEFWEYFSSNIDSDSYIDKSDSIIKVGDKYYHVIATAEIGTTHDHHDNDHYFVDDVKIIINEVTATPEMKGSIEVLWDIFGGTENDLGYKILDSHIGLIYGESINYETANTIFTLLELKGFASTNVVLGCGSFLYSMTSRDSYGQAIKSTFQVRNGVGKNIYKDPKTDDGTKKSAKGLLVVRDVEGVPTLFQEQTWEDVASSDNMLKIRFKDGEFFNQDSFETIRKRTSEANIL